MNDRLYRSVEDRVVTGVCGGLAERFDADPSLVRVGYAIVALMTGIFPLVILYVIMTIVVPEDPGWSGVPPVASTPWERDAGLDSSAAGVAGTQAAAMPGTDPAPGAGMASGPVSGWPTATPSWDPQDRRSRREAARSARSAARAARREARRDDPVPAILGGLVLVGLGAFFLLRNVLDIAWDVVWPAALVAVGVLLVLAALRPRAR